MGDDVNDRLSTGAFPDGTPDSLSLGGAQRYTMAESARIKGVSYHTVSRAVRQGRLPVFRLGRMALISGADLEIWQPMRERAPRRYRQAPAPIDPGGTVVLDEALGGRLDLARRLSTLFEVIHAASSTLTMSEFGDLLGRRFSTIFGLSRVSLWITNPKAGTAELLATVGPRMSATPPKVEIARGYGKFFAIVDLGNARVSLDPTVEFMDEPVPDVPMPKGPLLIVPLRVRGQTVGCIFGDREGQPLTLDEVQLSLAQVLGNQAALALDNARLRQEEQLRIAQLSTILDQVSDHVRACDIDGRLNLINRADKVVVEGELAEQPLGSDALHNPGVIERHELDGTPIPRDRHPLARALRGEEVTDWEYDVTRTDGRVQRARVSARPLIVDGEVTGAVYIGRNVTGLHEAQHRDQERETRAERAKGQAQAVARMVMEVQVTGTIRDAIRIALDCLSVGFDGKPGVALMAREDGGFEVAATSRLAVDFAIPIIHDPVSISTTILALAREAPVVVDHADAGRLEQGTMDLLGASGLMVVPMRGADRHFGALKVMFNGANPFEEEDLTFAATVGRLCAQAIERIRLCDEIKAVRTDSG